MIFLTLFWEYFKIGLFTIGGGYAMLKPVLDTVQSHGWMSDAEIYNFVGIAESTPGPFAINLATFVGITVGSGTSLGVFGGILGALVATVAVVLPSFVIIIIVTKLFQKFQTNRYVQGALYGIRPVVVGLVLSAVLSVSAKAVLPNLNLTAISKDGFSQFNWISLIILAAFFPLSQIKIKGKKIHPIILIVSAAVLGILIFGVGNVVQ
ncbi:MAG: chromate transporter [Corallococcus sp.]|nr:chromate transporter [Corallococcus sp.]MCM1359344.1 chromate transporter [Corallococcus sp.]MCM1394787.1 chromate transporter [Corallococcus sp.]